MLAPVVLVELLVAPIVLELPGEVLVLELTSVLELGEVLLEAVLLESVVAARDASVEASGELLGVVELL